LKRDELVLIGRPGCHLCDDMRAVVEAVALPLGFALREVDLGHDPDLEARYAFEIPVLRLGERDVCRHRVGPEELRALLREAD
jgi:hypothetical protein